MKITEQKKGDLAILAGGLLWGAFPVITVLSYSTLGPITSLAISTFFSGIFFAIVMTVKKRWGELANREVWKSIFWIAIIIGVALYTLLFLGLKHTSPGNASLIGLTEIFFSYILFNVWKSEKFSLRHIAGSLLMVLGATIILFPRGQAFNQGDILILLANVVAPFGNYIQQKTRKKISSESIMFGRNLITLPFLIILFFLFKERVGIADINNSITFLLLNGIVFFGFSKILWIEGIHRISVTKANALSSINPLFTIIFAYLILDQKPTELQITAFLPLFLGFILLTIKQNSPNSIDLSQQK